jgi:hypothetical protein
VVAALITAGAALYVAYGPPPTITVRNNLKRPVDIYIDDVSDRKLSPETVSKIKLQAYPVRVRYVVEKQRTNTGREIGDDFGGVFNRVFPNDHIVLRNRIGDQPYFYLILNNHANVGCAVLVNHGLLSEHRSGSIGKQRQNFHVGYYRWFRNSNVTLYCDNGKTYWWGQRRGDTVIPITELIKSDGSVTLTLRRQVVGTP